MTDADQAAIATRDAERTDDAKSAATGNWIDLWIYSGELISAFGRIVFGLVAGGVEIVVAFVAGLVSLFQ